jgi:hypothetical protein
MLSPSQPQIALLNYLVYHFSNNYALHILRVKTSFSLFRVVSADGMLGEKR